MSLDDSSSNNGNNMNNSSRVETCSASASVPSDLSRTCSPQIIVSITALMASTVLLGSLLLTESTTVASKVHPAVALALCWACLHGYCLLQGARVALPSLWLGSAQVEDSSLFQQSHPITFHLVTCTSYDCRLQAASLLETGAQTWTVALVFVLFAILQQTKDVTLFGWSSAALMIATACSLCLWISTLHRVAARQAPQCRLDWLNTPFMLFIWQACRIWDGVFDAVQVGLPLLWQGYAEKPQATQTLTATTSQARFYLRLVLSLVVLVTALNVVGHHVWNSHGIPGVVMVPCAMLAAGILPSATTAFSQLSHREQVVALDESTMDIIGKTNPQDNFLAIAGWISVAALTLGSTPASVPSYLLLLLCTILMTTAASLLVQAVAHSFPVSFLTHPITSMMLKLSFALRGLSRVATLVPSVYQPDDVYIGTPEERQAFKMAHDNNDVEALTTNNKKHIASYPQPTDDATVILEEHEF